MDDRFQERYLNEGFSGGEKKRNEMLQMALLEPDVAVLDETDSGLDIDALREVAAGIQEVRADRPQLGILLVTHYQRILDHLVPDVVHVLVDGRIVATGGPELARARRGGRVRRLPGTGGVNMTVVRRRHPQARLPDLRARGQRPAARLPRLRVVVAEAARGARRDGRLLPALLRQHPPRRVLDRRGIDRGVRGRARARSRDFVGAAQPEEIVFVRNATEAINLVAYTWARANLQAGDAIVLSHMEHHANVVPWHMLAAERGVELRWIPLTDDFRLDLTDLDELLDGAKLLAISAMSNVLGTINDIRPLADAAHAHDALVLVDACQFVPHVRDRRAGLGRRLRRVLGAQAARPERHRRAVGPPRAARSDAAVPRWRRDDPRRPRSTGSRRTTCRGSSKRARRRSSKRSGSVRPSTTCRRSAWTRYATTRCDSRATRSTRSRDRFPDSLTIYGPSDVSIRGGAVSFLFDGIHAHDISQVLDEDGVCVRAGHHCAKPLMRQLGVPATSRASVYVYNDEADVDVLVEALAKAQKFFAL